MIGQIIHEMETGVSLGWPRGGRGEIVCLVFSCLKFEQSSSELPALVNLFKEIACASHGSDSSSNSPGLLALMPVPVPVSDKVDSFR